MSSESTAKHNTSMQANMKSVFIKEGKSYSRDRLFELLRDVSKDFESDEVSLSKCIDTLRVHGILRSFVPSDFDDIDSSEFDENYPIDFNEDGSNYSYKCMFVGIIVVGGRVLKCYPKYISKMEPVEELRQIIDVLKEYKNSDNQDIYQYMGDDESGSFNLLSVLLYLLNDYYEYGVYSNTEQIIENNGMGDILWDKTINETFTLIFDDGPYYPNLQTIKTINSEFDYFKELHEYILTKASSELMESGLLDVFGIPEVCLSDKKLDYFGELSVILYNLEKEMNRQFNTRKQLLLKTMYAYLVRDKSLKDDDCFTLFGTNSFEHVWETVCATIFDNKLTARLDNLELPKPLNGRFKDMKRAELIEIIKYPYWSAAGYANHTLIPDIISISSDNFIIIDAKYYVPRFVKGEHPVGQPGVESVAKQYLYRLAYEEFTTVHGFKKIMNFFVFPTEGDGIIDSGSVNMEMLSELGLGDIKVRFIPAGVCFDCYISGRKMNITDLDLT